MLKQGGYQLMMVNSSYSPATDAVAAQLDEMNAILKQYDENAMITGRGAMYRDLIDTTAVDFVVANYLSIACIFIIVAWAFKSITVPAVLVATIELAIFLNQGFSYFSGASTPFIAPTIISCVQLGATVDYAILMTSRFQEELAKRQEPKGGYPHRSGFGGRFHHHQRAGDVLRHFGRVLCILHRPHRRHLHHAGPGCSDLRLHLPVRDACRAVCLRADVQ